MLRDDYECLGIAATYINRKGMTFFEVIREKGNQTFCAMHANLYIIALKCLKHLNCCISLIVYVRDCDSFLLL